MPVQRLPQFDAYRHKPVFIPFAPYPKREILKINVVAR